MVSNAKAADCACVTADIGDIVDVADMADTKVTAELPTCARKCSDKECGDDGCGGMCGKCPAVANKCALFKCVANCIPNCSGKQCGDDGCGDKCGKCAVATPNCTAGTCVAAASATELIVAGAVLAGQAVGSGAADVSALRKVVPVVVQTPSADFQFGSAFVMRQTSSDESAYVSIAIKNLSKSAICFVEIDGVAWLDQKGGILAQSSLTFAESSHQNLVAPKVTTDTCLAPGETGDVTLIEAAFGADSPAYY